MYLFRLTPFLLRILYSRTSHIFGRFEYVYIFHSVFVKTSPHSSQVP